MRANDFRRQLLAALARDTPAFRPRVATPTSIFGRLAAALARDTVVPTRPTVLVNESEAANHYRPTKLGKEAQIGSESRYQQQIDKRTQFISAYDRHLEALLAYAYFRIGGRQHAEDVTSDTFFRALQRFDDLPEEDREVRLWLLAMSREIINKGFATEDFSEALLGTLRSDLSDPMPKGERDTKSDIKRTAIAVSALRPEQRDFVILRFGEGLTVADVAQVMRKSAGAINRLQYRSILALAKSLSIDLDPFRNARKGLLPLRAEVARFAYLVDETDFDQPGDPSLGSSALVELVQQLRRGLAPMEPDPEHVAGLRALLLSTIDHEGIGGSRSTNSSQRENSSKKPSRTRRLGAMIISVVVGAVAVSGLSVASEDATPGDTLYGIKRNTERAQLALSTSDAARGQLFLDFAVTRLAEASAVGEQTFGFASALEDMDAVTVQGTKLLTTSAAKERNPARLDVIDAFVAEQIHRLAALRGNTSQAGRQPIDRSMNLLDGIQHRSDTLRAALVCGVGSTGQADSLGPIPGRCTTR